ncbi:hypothetical protein TYRP_008723, partial [Tyrophagus putrescentiae]
SYCWGVPVGSAAFGGLAVILVSTAYQLRLMLLLGSSLGYVRVIVGVFPLVRPPSAASLYCWGVPVGSAAFGGLAVILVIVGSFLWFGRFRQPRFYVRLGLLFGCSCLLGRLRRPRCYVRLGLLMGCSPWLGRFRRPR